MRHSLAIEQCTITDSSFRTKQLQENQTQTRGLKSPIHLSATSNLHTITISFSSLRQSCTNNRIYLLTPKTGPSTQAGFCGFEPLTKNQEPLSCTNRFHTIAKLQLPRCQCLCECFRLLLELMSPLTIFLLSIILEAKHM